tara:strand:- start:104 stop:1111 length:1008 start_codon:yes stop_codon:yes gene_type:complete
MLWHDEPQNTLFHRIVAILFIVALAFSLLILTIELPALTRAEKEKLPAQLVKIIARKAAVEAIKPKTETELVPVIEPVLESVPEPIADLPTDLTADSTVKAKEKKVAKAKAKARRSGLLALSAELSQMHESAQTESFFVNEAYPTLLVSTQQVAKAEVAEVNALSAIALTSGPTLNETVFTTRTVPSSNFDGGKTLTRQSRAIVQDNLLAKTNEASAKSLETPSSTVSNAQSAQSDNNVNDRTTESIRQVFDKNKGALYAIYRRALRQDPALKGKVTIDITIEPDGAVSMIKLVLSELDSAELENKLLARISMINFTAQGLNAIQLKYTFNFLPF